ncbi:MAG: hypothetical protein KJP18_17775 [Gemmatimonadetes bacterium]|nr:hypothetical protein [Gemmatimonadota bacterium]NNK61585.1 hypothetical protein [Gemmatimonadota bacterium]
MRWPVGTRTPGANHGSRLSTRPIPPLEYLERYRNEGTRTYSRHAAYSECRPEYQPTIGASEFDLPCWELPRDAVQVYRADPPPALEARYLPADRALFVVHPQVTADAGSDPWLVRTVTLGRSIPALRVSPGSSTRTLFVLGDAHDHALKVHFPFRVSRYGRRMRNEVVAQAIAASAEIQEWCGGGDPTFAFLREVIGVAHPRSESDTGRGENWGYLVRDLRPYPRVGEDRSLVPGFALYGRDRFEPTLDPLIVDLADAGDPLGWTLHNVMLPIIRHWVGCYRSLGFILEPHGQNVLVELDRERAVQRLVHRDLSVGIDMRRRRDQGVPDGALNPYNRFENGIFASIAYDRFLGGHFFGYLARALMDRHPRLSIDDFRRPCREAFGRLFPDHDRYMPRSQHYFAEARDTHGKPLHRDTGEPPAWRP